MISSALLEQFSDRDVRFLSFIGYGDMEPATLHNPGRGSPIIVELKDSSLERNMQEEYLGRYGNGGSL